MSGVLDAEATAGPPAEVIPLRVGGQRRAARLTATVVVLTRDSEDQLRRSLVPLRQAASAADAELLFVDLGSTDATREYAAGNAPGAGGVWLERQDGLGEALAVAATASAADVMVFVTPSIRPTGQDAIVRMLEHLARHPAAAAVAPVPDSVFAIRRTDLIEVIEGPERRLDTHADLLIELILQGRQLHSRDGERWRELGERRAAGRRITDRSRPRPMVLHVAECFAAGTERQRLEPDVVHGHSSIGGALARMARRVVARPGRRSKTTRARP